MKDFEKTRKTGVSIASFLTGAAIGSGIALLTAHKTGHETRERLKEGFSGVGDKARGYLEKGRDRFRDLRAKVTHAVAREETAVHA